MEDNTSLWNKRVDDLTVGETVKLSVVSPIVVMGGFALAGVIFSAVGAAARKLRKTENVNLTATEQ